MPRQFEVIDRDCTGCRLCEERAPENFEIPAGSSTAQVVKQPETPEEEEACVEASEYCPLGGLRAREPQSETNGVSSASTPAGDSTSANLN
ncbi:MAG: ferredoxin [bacterium]|nr:ferredoxin [bacterium]